MFRSWGGAALALLTALSLSGCAPKAVAGPTPSPSPRISSPGPGPAVKEGVVSQLNDFSRRLYSRVAPTMEGNLAVSPLGSFVLLDLLYEGSRGPAHDEMAKVLGFTPASLTEVASLLKSLESPQLSLAQRIFLDDQRAVLVDAYLQRVGGLLDEPVLLVPFGTDMKRAVATINGWVEERTRGLLKDFLPELPPLTVCVLVSALHYQGQWAHPFPKANTMPGDFAGPGGSMKVSMMRLASDDVALFSVPGGRAVVLPHTDKTEMLLILPDEGRTPDQMLEGLDSGVFRAAPSGGDVVVELPRFEFTVDTFELTEAWREVGLRATTGSADMSAMLRLDPPDPVELIVYHKTYVKVNEEGTEAAAATAVVMVPKGAPASRQEPEVIRFDRPFAFVLRDSSNGAVLMMGRVEEPTPAP